MNESKQDEGYSEIEVSRAREWCAGPEGQSRPSSRTHRWIATIDWTRADMSSAQDHHTATLTARIKRLEEQVRQYDQANGRMAAVLEIVRDADNDCIMDGLRSIPKAARAEIDAALDAAKAGA